MDLTKTRIYLPHHLVNRIYHLGLFDTNQVLIIDCGLYLFNQNSIGYIASQDDSNYQKAIKTFTKADISALSEVVTFKSFCDYKKNSLMCNKIMELMGVGTEINILHPDEYTYNGVVHMSVEISILQSQLEEQYLEIKDNYK